MPFRDIRLGDAGIVDTAIAESQRRVFELGLPEYGSQYHEAPEKVPHS